MHALFPSLLALLSHQIEVAYAAETGNIQGLVTDESDLPIPGAEVTLSGADLAGERMVSTNDDGSFRFGDLSPGTYELTVTFKGAMVARAEVRVSLGTTTNVPIPARMGAVAEEIEVLGFKPVIDTTDSSFSTSLGQAEFQELPVGRSYQDVIQTIPGVSGRIDTSGGGNGNGNPSVRGEGQYGNNYAIDGVSTRDPATKTYGQDVNFDAIEEIQVYTDGAPAEFGQFTGMMVNVVTKDGGDEHHGSAAIFYSQHAFIDNEYDIFNPDTIREEPTIKARFRAPVLNATAGGPLIQEKLWYFTALDMNYNWALPEGVDELDAQGDSNAVTALGGQVMGKLTWFPTPAWTFRYIFNGSYDTSARIDASQFVAEGATTDRVDWGQNHRLTATLTPDDKNVLELHAGYLNQNIDIVPTSGDRDTPSRLDSQGKLEDNSEQFDFNDRNRFGGGLSYTRFLDNFLGSHEFKVGAEYWTLLAQRELLNTGAIEGFQWINTDGTPGDPTDVGTRYAAYDDPSTPEFDYPCNTPGDDGDCGIREHWTNVGPLGNKVMTYQGYIQDDWTPARQLTMNLGVRADIEDGRADADADNDGDLDRPPTLDPTKYDANGYFGGIPAADSENPGEYGPIMMVAPRLGFALDPMADGHTKISGHYGQYYDLAGNNLWEWANSRSANSFVRYLRDADGNFTWSNTQDAAGSPLIYDENLRPAVMNKVNIGVEREVVKDFSVGLRGILSATTDSPEDVDANYQDWYIMSIPIKRRYYRAIELTVRRQFDEVWQVYGSYTLSEAFGNTPGQFELAPGATSGSDGNNVGVYLDDVGDQETRELWYENGFGWVLEGFHGLGHYSPKDPTYYDEAGWYGYLPYHSFHMIKLNGSYTAPFGTNFGLVYEFDSGHAWEKKTLVPFYGFDAFGQGRGSRFMPAVHYVDFRVGHTFEFGPEKEQSLEATLDVFNVPGFAQAITYYSNDAPGFGQTLYRQSPRSIRLGVKYRY